VVCVCAAVHTLPVVVVYLCLPLLFFTPFAWQQAEEALKASEKKLKAKYQEARKDLMKKREKLATEKSRLQAALVAHEKKMKPETSFPIHDALLGTLPVKTESVRAPRSVVRWFGVAGPLWCWVFVYHRFQLPNLVRVGVCAWPQPENVPRVPWHLW